MAIKQKQNNKPIISKYYKNNNKIMKLIEIINSVESLNKLAETKLSAATAFSLSKFLKDVTPDVDNYNKVKIEKATQYGTPVFKDGNKTDEVSFKDAEGQITEDGKKFVAEMQELENKEMDFNIPEIKISDLGSAVFEPKYLMQLAWLIKE